MGRETRDFWHYLGGTGLFLYPMEMTSCFQLLAELDRIFAAMDPWQDDWTDRGLGDSISSGSSQSSDSSSSSSDSEDSSSSGSSGSDDGMVWVGLRGGEIVRVYRNWPGQGASLTARLNYWLGTWVDRILFAMGPDAVLGWDG